jgi:hypothetical protein
MYTDKENIQPSLNRSTSQTKKEINLFDRFSAAKEEIDYELAIKEQKRLERKELLRIENIKKNERSNLRRAYQLNQEFNDELIAVKIDEQEAEALKILKLKSKQLCEADELLSKKLQNQLTLENEKHRRRSASQEEKDAKLAKKLQEQEIKDIKKAQQSKIITSKSIKGIASSVW